MVDRNCKQCCQWTYAAITVLGLLTGICFALYGIVVDRFKTEDSSYLFIFIVNSVFAIVYVLKGVKYKDPYDIAILGLSVVPPVLYITINYILVKPRTTFKEVRLIFAVPFGFFIVGCGFYFFYHFCRRKEFMKFYGLQSEQISDRSTSGYSFSNNEINTLKNQIRTMKLFYFLTGANLQIDLSASVFTLTSGYAVELKSGTFLHIDMLFVFVPIMLVAVAACLAGYLAVRREEKCLVWIFAVLSLILAGAGLYLLIMSIKDLRNPNRNHVLSSVATFASTLMIFVRIISCTGCYLATINFGKGLKDLIYQTQPERQRLLASPTDPHTSEYGLNVYHFSELEPS